MFPHVIAARHIERQIVHLTFDDGLEGPLDLGPFLKGPVFEPLKQETEFAKLQLDTKAGTIFWPNGADIAPEFLHEQLNRVLAAAE
jgi:hypothetical protein